MGVGCTAHAPENASMFEDDMAFAATLRVLDAGDPAVMAEQRGRFGTSRVAPVGFEDRKRHSTRRQ